MMGGNNGSDKNYAECYELHISQNKLTPIAPMKSARNGFGVANVNSKI